MSSPHPPGSTIRFGEFTADLEAQDLFRNGSRVRLQGQPFEILAVLLERPGRVVTREELRRRLWPSDTFVDFEHGLNAAVNRLREAFGDSAEEPRYIETIPRRGYRFIAPLDGRPSVSARRRASKWAAIGGVAAMALLALLVALNLRGWRDLLLGRVSSPRIESLAVLPLENLSGDPQQEYFADGMTETLIAELSKISGLKVISRTSVMHYKGGARKPLPQIARELGVDGVVEGTVTREGEQVRISVQLIHGSTDQHLWAENYQRELRGILVLQSEVARAIAGRIQAKLTPQELGHLTRTRSVNPEAYQLYLQGRNFVVSFGGEDFFRKGARYLEDSVAKDPNYAPAYSALAFAYMQLAMFGYDPPKVAYPKARSTVMKALELDENLGEAHAVLGHIKLLFDWDWSGAEKEERRALELSPNSADTHDEYGFYLTLMGRADEGIAQLQKALELDPVPVQRTVNVAWSDLMAGRYDDAIVYLKKALELDPDYPAAHMELASAYAGKRMRAEANAEYEKTRTFVPAGKDMEVDLWLVSFYAPQGKRDEGLKLADWWSRESKRRHVDAYSVGLLYAQLGAKERALDWLEKGFEQHSPLMPTLKIAAAFFLDSLRSDPRFQNLLHRMNFPP